MAGFAHDFSGPDWVTLKRRLVHLCVNERGEPLLAALGRVEPGDCVLVLQPVLGDWLDTEIVPAIELRIRAADAASEGWSVALALFTFAPVGLKHRPPDAAPDKLTPDLCRSVPELRRALLRGDDARARAVLGQGLGHHLADTKHRLVVVELKQLNLKVWWKIERAMREVLATWEADMAADDLARRRRASTLAASDQALCEAILARVGKQTDIKHWQHIQRYVDTFGRGDEIALIEDAAGPGEDPWEVEDLLISLEQCLYAEDGPEALSAPEREAVLREYIAGIPQGMPSAVFTKTYGISRPIHNRLVRSGVEKLGRCLDNQLGEDR
jgi:hypothetical protein